MKLAHKDQDGIRVITVDAARLDAAVAIEFKDMFAGLIDPGISHYVLDLARIEFMDSSGLGSVVACLKLLGEGGHLHLAALQPVVAKVFQLTRMDSVFRILPDASRSLTQLKAA